MMYRPNIIVAQRKATFVKGMFSRGTSSRLCEPFDYLQANGYIRYQVIDEEALNVDSLEADIIVFYKHLSDVSVVLSEQAKAKKIKVIYDIDDALLSPPKCSGKTMDDNKKTNFYQHMALADVVTIATPYLQQVTSQYINRETCLVTNGFNIERHYKKTIKKEDGPKKIIYTNADYIKLETFKKAFIHTLNNFLKCNNNYVFCAYSDYPDDLAAFERCHYLGSVDWFVHKKELLEGHYDLAIVPLSGEEDVDALVYNACKSPIKYLEYGGLQIPGIYSDTPVYRDVIEHRVNGLLVKNNETAWKNALDELASDKNLRQKIIDNAFDDVRSNHHVSKAAAQWLSIFEGV